MSYELTFAQNHGWLHAIVRGRNTPENVVGYLEAVMRECQARACIDLLIEEQLEGPRLGTIDVFEIASRQDKPWPGALRSIAYVDLNRAPGTLMQFAEDVAVNRGVPVRIFPTVADAETWLRGRVGPRA
jgi:hypothetical protein